MKPNIPTSDVYRPQSPQTSPRHSAVHGAGTVPQVTISPGTLIRTPRAVMQLEAASQAEIQRHPDTSLESDYELHVSGTDVPQQTQDPTSTPRSTSSHEFPFFQTTDRQAIPLPPPSYDSATSQVPDSELHRHLDILVRDNIRLREDNKRKLEEIQQTTAIQMATLTDSHPPHQQPRSTYQNFENAGQYTKECQLGGGYHNTTPFANSIYQRFYGGRAAARSEEFQGVGGLSSDGIAAT